MEDLINIACEQALKKLIGKRAEEDKGLRKCNYDEESCSVEAVEMDLCNKISHEVDSNDGSIITPLEEMKVEDSTDPPQIDPKLLLDPKVCTMKLDDMGLFKDKPFNSVHSKEIIDLIYIKSNPLRNDNMVTSEKCIHVETVTIESSDDEYHLEDNNCDDETAHIEYNPIKTERGLPSNSLRKNQTHRYNHFQLLNNPDLQESINQLNNDVNGLINDGTHLNDCETSVQRELNKIDSKIQLSIVKVSSAKSITESFYCESVQSISTGNPERNRAINLPNISEVRRINQQLRTAEVPPVQAQSNNIKIPSISNQSPRRIVYRKIAPNTQQQPPSIMHKQIDVSKTNAPLNMVNNNNILASEPIAFREEHADECICAKQVFRTPNQNLIIKISKCRFHENTKTQNKTKGNRALIVNNVHGSSCKLFSTGRHNIIVTSAPTPQSSVCTPPSDVQLNLLPNGEVVYAPTDAKTGLKLSGNIYNTTNKPNCLTLGKNVQNRYIVSCDANSSQLNAIQGMHDGVDQTFKITQSGHPTIHAMNNSNDENEKHLCISPVNATSGQLWLDNQVLHKKQELQPELSQQTLTLRQLVPVSTESEPSINSEISFDKTEGSNKNNGPLITDNITPSNIQEFNLKTQALPKLMTIDLTDDDGSTAVNPVQVFLPIVVPQNVAKDPIKERTETKLLLIENPNKAIDILTSVSGETADRRINIVSKVVAKQSSTAVLNRRESQERLNKINDAIITTKEPANVPRYVRIAANNDKQTRKRNAVTARLPDGQLQAKRSSLEPRDTTIKYGSDSIILKTIVDEFEKARGNETASDFKAELDTAETSDWVIEGI